jgi:glycine oxidase
MAARVTVVGGGVIGLSCAWRLVGAGHDVTLVAPNPGRDGASWVAAGMLAPVTEVQFGEARLTELLLEGAAAWKEFATSLERASGHDVGYDESGTLTVALDASDRAVLDQLLAYQHALGGTAHRRTATECRAMVPSLTPNLRGGIEVPGDHHVDNRALLGALVAACRAGGVRFVTGRVATVIAGAGGSVPHGPAVELIDGGRLDSDFVLVAAGTGTPAIGGLAGPVGAGPVGAGPVEAGVAPPGTGLPEIRPVKGHILRLGPPPGAGGGMMGSDPPPLLPRTVRALARGRSIYLVPRPDGTVVVGATMEERGDDLTVRAGAVHELLCDARAIVPGIDEFVLLEAQAGLRPATPDNLPFVGWTDLPGVAVASGHFRNGMLLAPLTASVVVELVGGGVSGP